MSDAILCVPDVASTGRDDDAEVTSPSETPHGQHETSTDAIETAEHTIGGEETGSEGAQGLLGEDAPISLGAGSSGAVQPPASKQSPLKPKVSTSNKIIAGKTNGGPPTPLAKKMIDPTTKPTTSKPAAHATSAKASPPGAIRRSSSSSAIQPQTKPSAASQPAPPGRRVSGIPAKPGAVSGVSKPALSSSTSSKPVASGVPRPSVISPVSSATPRASVSEGVKRVPLKPTAVPNKPSAPSKPTTTRPSSAAPARASASISSIREVQEDGKALEELQEKLKGLTEALALKNKLEEQLADLSSSLADAQADVASKTILAERLAAEKSLLETELRESKQGDDSILVSLQAELELAKASATTQTELVSALHTQLQAMEEQVSTSKDAFETLQASASSDANIAAIEREALFKAKEDLASISTEIETLRFTHAQTLQEAQTKMASLEEKCAKVDDLNAQNASLKAKKQETARKLSELEVEILELKESLENLEEERDRWLAKAMKLDEELITAKSAMQQAIEQSESQTTSLAAQLASLENDYKERLTAASDEHAKLVSDLEALKSDLIGVHAENEALREEAVTTEQNHAQKLQETEQLYLLKEIELLDKIKDVTAAFQGQEALYNSKVEAVKAEHNHLLQEAFERAKHEAGVEHAKELQAFRESSSATLEQIQAAQQVATSELKAEHTALLESEVTKFEKSISALRLDLKATQDDLAKAKSGLELSRTEINTLTIQLQEARVSASSTGDVVAARGEAVRLAQQLANAKDDLTAVNEALSLTKASLAEMSNNHSRDLEDAVQSRVEEVTKLRSSYDEEIRALVTDKSTLLVKLSDMEGELSTLKASVAISPASLKSNGNGTPPHAPGVTKEELQRLHEAHNLKIHDLEAEHQKVIKALREDLEASDRKAVELQQEVDRKTMENQLMERDTEEKEEQITRLTEEIHSLSERLSK